MFVFRKLNKENFIKDLENVPWHEILHIENGKVDYSFETVFNTAY